jgi:glutamate dehydrogenase (NAD(P)+)
VFFGIREVLEDTEFCKAQGIPPGLKGKTIIVQGFGNVGYYASKYMTEFGAKLIGVSEIDGSFYNPDGIDVEELYKYK